jgi:hypothetical protein
MNSPQAGGHSPAGFPHSEISGSRPVSDSPELIAAVHVLHRLWLPRHPPYALRSLTLSLRHASSRARDSTCESRSLALSLRVHFFACISLPLDVTIYSRCPENISFDFIQLSMNGGQDSYPCCEGPCDLPQRKLCGADRDRTDDLRLAKPALSQLSYSPGGGDSPSSGGRCRGPGQS